MSAAVFFDPLSGSFFGFLFFGNFWGDLGCYLLTKVPLSYSQFFQRKKLLWSCGVFGQATVSNVRAARHQISCGLNSIQDIGLQWSRLSSTETSGHLEKRRIFEKDGDWFMKHDRSCWVLLPSGVVSPLYLVAALKSRWFLALYADFGCQNASIPAVLK